MSLSPKKRKMTRMGMDGPRQNMTAWKSIQPLTSSRDVSEVSRPKLHDFDVLQQSGNRNNRIHPKERKAKQNLI